MNNQIWRRGICTCFLNFLQRLSLKYILLIAFSSIIDHNNGTTCHCLYSQLVLGIFIFYSTFLKVENGNIFFLFEYIPRSRGLLSIFPTSQNWEVWESPLPVPFVFKALPLGGKSNGTDFFGLGEGLLPSPSWGYGTVQINYVNFPTNQQKQHHIHWHVLYQSYPRSSMK